MLVSFIIPAYNAADTIERCLDSIYSLSLKQDEFDVIVIDDCSSDNTIDIVAAYQSKHPNITLLKQQENHRQGAARNRGVKMAKGEYTCFVDSDDAVTEGVVKAIRIAKEKQTDMTAYHYAFINELAVITKEAEQLSFADRQVFSGIEMQNKHPYWCSGPVAYIYSRAFMEQTNYPFVEDVLFEDSDFVMNHLYRAERMVYSPALGYMVYTREGSTTRSITYKSVADYLLLGTRMMALFERVYNEELIVKSEDSKKFAEGILEGACFNVAKSCKSLIKLDSINEVQAYYDRVDTHLNRTELVKDKRYRKCFWNVWTTICLKHEQISKVLLVLLMPMYKIVKI